MEKVHFTSNKGHSESTFALNFQFLNPSPSLFVPVPFTCIPPTPPSTDIRFSELPTPFSKKISATLMLLIWNRKFGGGWWAVWRDFFWIIWIIIWIIYFVNSR